MQHLYMFGMLRHIAQNISNDSNANLNAAYHSIITRVLTYEQFTTKYLFHLVTSKLLLQ